MTALLLTGCVRNPAPKNWLKPAPESESDPYGAWITVERARPQLPITGEFLAVDHDSLYVLEPAGSVITVPVADATRARIAFYDAVSKQLIAWNTVGMLSTLSHGAFLVLTVPLLWGAAGSAIVANNSHLPIVDVKMPHQWQDARKYARFPAGLPVGLPRKLPVKQ